MLNVDTRQRINTARDILVGKVPDPKSQVEQITIALIYKFMDDMDQQSIEMGGKASFFTGEYAKYAWSNIFNPRLGGFEMLALYADAITTMSLNPNLPQLFRDIFKNAYLPYRDPETLKLFLKTINEFSYDHSERLGDAFEFLLSVLGSQGDAGQFRTPRHIIEFMVQVIKPQKNETILDPACGTAGFLIAAYKYILGCNKKRFPGDLLRPDERKRLLSNLKGYDISPDMGRLSRVNMFLHGFQQPQIFEYDTLTSEERWNEYADVILANPPFMSPKGGIRPHKRFSVQSNRSEVLFVDYMAEHLTPTGRAAIIVPEGIIFQSSGAYKQLRKYLIEENFLWALVSLPTGVFNPYAGVKTSILLLDRAMAKKTDKVLFIKVEADGFSLGAQRRPVEENDLPSALRALENWQKAVRDENFKNFEIANQSCSAIFVEKTRLADNGEYNLSMDRYRETILLNNQKWPVVTLGEVVDRVTDTIDPNNFSGPVTYIGLENIVSNTGALTGEIFSNYEEIKSTKTKFIIGDVLYGKLRPNLNKVYLSKVNGICSTDICVFRARELINARYLSEILRSPMFNAEVLKGLGGAQLPRVSFGFLSGLKLPLPPLELQYQIVDKIDSFQRIINGARQVIDSWKPIIDIDPEWQIVKLGDIALIERGASPRPIESYITRASNGVNWVKIGDAGESDKYIYKTEEKISLEGAKKSRKVNIGDFVLSNSMSFGRPYIMKIDGYIHDGWLLIREDSSKISKDFLYYILSSNLVLEQFEKAATGGVVRNLNSQLVRNVEIPLPTVKVQNSIVEALEQERQIIEGNRQLIQNYEAKIHKIIMNVWKG